MVDQGFHSTQFGVTERYRERDGEREQPQKENKKADEKERKTARLFVPTCLDLKEEKREKTKTHRRLGRLEKGEHKGEKDRRRGRGREQICAQPQKARRRLKPKSWNKQKHRLHRDQSTGKRLGWKETFDTGSAGREGSLIRRILPAQRHTKPPPAISKGLGYVNKTQSFFFFSFFFKSIGIYLSSADLLCLEISCEIFCKLCFRMFYRNIISTVVRDGIHTVYTLGLSNN